MQDCATVGAWLLVVPAFSTFTEALPRKECAEPVAHGLVWVLSVAAASPHCRRCFLSSLQDLRHLNNKAVDALSRRLCVNAQLNVNAAGSLARLFFASSWKSAGFWVASVVPSERSKWGADLSQDHNRALTDSA